jgi:hypothetical protein
VTGSSSPPSENLLFHARLGGGAHLAHMVDQGVDQIVVYLLIALQEKAQEIEARHSGGQLLQLLHSIIIDECGIIGDAVVGYAQFRQQRFRCSVQYF